MRESLARFLARAQARRPFLILFFALLVTAGALKVASKLEVESGFEHLLPDGRASVKELHRVAEHTAGVSTLFVVIEVPASSPPARKELRAASDALTTEIRAIGEPYVGSADNGVKDALAFLEPRAGLYVDKADLESLLHDVDARFQYEVAKQMDTLIDDDPPPPIDQASIKKRLHLDEGMGDRYPDGYFESKDGRTEVIAIRSKVLGADVANGKKTLELVRAAIAKVDLEKYQPGHELRVRRRPLQRHHRGLGAQRRPDPRGAHRRRVDRDRGDAVLSARSHAPGDALDHRVRHRLDGGHYQAGARQPEHGVELRLHHRRRQRAQPGRHLHVALSRGPQER